MVSSFFPSSPSAATLGLFLFCQCIIRNILFEDGVAAMMPTTAQLMRSADDCVAATYERCVCSREVLTLTQVAVQESNLAIAHSLDYLAAPATHLSLR